MEEMVVFVMGVSSYPVETGLVVSTQLMLPEEYCFVSTQDFPVAYSVVAKNVAGVAYFRVCQEYYFVVAGVHKYFLKCHIVDRDLLRRLYLYR